DLAMTVRRENVPGERTPDGILTRFAKTALGRIVEEIEASPDPRTIDLGFVLLAMGEKTVNEISKSIITIAQMAKRDGKNHDFSVGIRAGGTGLTFHCNNDPVLTAG